MSTDDESDAEGTGLGGVSCPKAGALPIACAAIGNALPITAPCCKATGEVCDDLGLPRFLLFSGGDTVATDAGGGTGARGANMETRLANRVFISSWFLRKVSNILDWKSSMALACATSI